MIFRTSLVLSLLILLASCTSDSLPPSEAYNNTFSALRNGSEWEGTTEISLTDNDSLLFLGIGDGLDNGTLFLKQKFNGKGTYALTGNMGRYYNTLGGDALISQYRISEEGVGFLQIDTFNEREGSISGSFALEMMATGVYATPEDSTLLLTEGCFRGLIIAPIQD